jgi:hypothetical protein
MAYDTLFIGNILTAETDGVALIRGRITISGAGYFTFTDRFLLLSPPQWIENEVEFDYRNPSGELLRKVINYKARFDIEIQLAGRTTLRDLQNLLTLMNNPQIQFNAAGFTRGFKFYLTLDGDATAPTLECVLVSDHELKPKYIADRLIGYEDLNFTVETKDPLSEMQLPKALERVTSITTGTRSVSSRVYAGLY